MTIDQIRTEIRKVNAELKGNAGLERGKELIRERHRLRVLFNDLRLPTPEDISQRYVCEATVVALQETKKGTLMHVGGCVHGHRKGCDKSGWKFLCLDEKENSYRVGDTVRLGFRFAPRKGSKRRSWWPKILPPPARDEIHEQVGYDS